MIDINRLAALSRIELTDEEKGKIEKDLGSILGYVSEIKGAPSIDVGEDAEMQRNVMRDDIDPYDPGFFTKDILSEAPKAEGGYLVVKKILEK